MLAGAVFRRISAELWRTPGNLMLANAHKKGQLIIGLIIGGSGVSDGRFPNRAL
jgi:hypothetical protein